MVGRLVVVGRLVGVSVVGGFNKAHLELDLKKLIDYLVTNCDRLTYYKLRQNPITNCDKFITNCDRYYNLRQIYCKLR